MRIDKFLCFVRLTKTRSVAQALIEARHLRLDSRRVERPATEVMPGSVVTFVSGGRVRVIRVLTLPERRGPAAEARACYADIEVDGGAHET